MGFVVVKTSVYDEKLIFKIKASYLDTFVELACFVCLITSFDMAQLKKKQS